MLVNGTFELDRTRVAYGVVIDASLIRYSVPTLECSSFAVFGDCVSYDISEKRIIKIIKRSNTLIPGVLLLSSHTIEAKTQKGDIMKRFIPSDKRYPPFRVKVPHNRLSSSSDCYVLIKFVNWQENHKIPNGVVDIFIGEVGNKQSELEYLKYRHNIRWKKYKKFDKNEFVTDLTPERRDLTNYTIYSVDPDGCRDIDDALHITCLGSGQYQIGVHIADVSSYIKEGSYVDDEITKRVETSYLANEQNNMLPDVLATEVISLTSGTPKRAFSILFCVNSDGTYEVVWIGKTMIQIKENLSYEEAERRTQLRDTDIENLYNIGKLIHRDESYYDWHKTVEVFMIMANAAIASIFAAKIPESGIYRRHTGTAMPQFGNDVSETLKKRAFVRKLARAEYVVGNVPNHRHNSLGLEHYTHFTSPIRRVADIIVHRILFKILSEQDYEDLLKIDFKDNLSTLCSHINEQKKHLDLAQRESHVLNTLFKIYQDKDGVVNNVIAHVIGIKDNYVELYIPAMDLEADCKLFSNKLRHTIKCTSTEDTIETDNGIFLKLYDIIEVTVIVRMKQTSIRGKLVIQHKFV
jgi:exoribonuclease R